MRKVIFFMFTSLDGYFERSDRDITWHNVDDEFNEFAIQHTGEFGMFLFGRVTYELMAGCWPTDAAKWWLQCSGDKKRSPPIGDFTTLKVNSSTKTSKRYYDLFKNWFLLRHRWSRIFAPK